MWSPVLALTLLLAFDPARLGLVLLLISRPRPVPNVLAYWLGAMTVGVPYMLVPLMVLHITPAFRSFAQQFATPATFTSPLVRHIQFGIGVLALSIAVLMAVRLRARERVQLATPGDTTSTLVLDPNTSTANSRALRRLRGRARNAWDNGSLWVAWLIGLGSGPPPLTILLVLTSIMASGAAIGTQVSLAVAWLVGMFAVVEIILASYLAVPAKTQAVLRLLHDWVLAHRQQVLIALFAVIGVAMVAVGMG